MDESVNLKKMPIEMIEQPIDFEVRGYQTFKLNVPIVIRDNAPISEQIYEFILVFRGPNGNAFGD